MRKGLIFGLFFCILIWGVGTPVTMAAKNPNEIIEEAMEVLQEMAKKDDAENLGRLLKQAEGVAVFPSVIKAGLVLGGRYGQGILLKRDHTVPGAWFGPHFVTISGASWGLQAGVQSTALVMVIMNERGMKGFTGDKFTLGGDVSVAAGPVGRQTGVGTDGSFTAEIFTYSMSKGVFAGLSLEGSVISSDKERNEDFWGGKVPIESILKRKSEDLQVQSFIKALNNLVVK
ncbi:MAG TPA: lipid-binding SYLF domain-containing protein [Bacillota bacterium]